jgi:hypothetical protein
MISRRLEELDLGTYGTRRHFRVVYAAIVAAVADHGKP